MRITKIQIHNYKCFNDTQEIALASGFNVIVGKNNAGKTSFAEALSLRIEEKPHRSLKTVPYRNAIPKSGSSINISFELDQDEFINLLKDKFLMFVMPRQSEGGDDNYDRVIQKIFFDKQSLIRCRFSPSGSNSAYFESLGEQAEHRRALRYEIGREDIHPRYAGSSNADLNESLAYKIAPVLKDKIYYFKAERLNVGQYIVGANSTLQSDASNLAQVLHFLSTSNSFRFQKLVDHIKTIFPEITHISVPPINTESSQQSTRISLWTTNDSERDDLAMPLQESGTGIGQVLAILYIALTSDTPIPIIIDEPQSFLHPGAVRKLISILKQYYPQHQYIITTHSPATIISAEPTTLLLARKDGNESVIETIDMRETNKLSLLLSEVGARLSDVFGADNILWVEGRTEEICFPLILSKVVNEPTLGTSIIGVKQTGDLEGKHARTIFEIYTKLSEGKGLLPPAIGFIFDREGRSDKDRKGLVDQSKGKVKFTHRRMFENYLLNSQAIATVLSNIQETPDLKVEVPQIEAWLKEHQWEQKYFEQTIKDEIKNDAFWIENVHAARILDDVFKSFSSNRLTYEGNKVEYGVQLTTWSVENSPSDLSEIATLIKQSIRPNS